MKKTDWVILHQEGLPPQTIGGKCLRCGQVETLKLPCEIELIGKWTDFILMRHRLCREPEQNE